MKAFKKNFLLSDRNQSRPLPKCPTDSESLFEEDIDEIKPNETLIPAEIASSDLNRTIRRNRARSLQQDITDRYFRKPSNPDLKRHSESKSADTGNRYFLLIPYSERISNQTEFEKLNKKETIFSFEQFSTEIDEKLSIDVRNKKDSGYVE